MKDLSDKERIEKLESFDCLEEAENLAKALDLSSSKQTDALALGLQLGLNKTANALAEKTRDTRFDMNMADYLEVCQDIGFEIVLEESFLHGDSMDSYEGKEERLYLLWHSDGILLRTDTYCSERRNSAEAYFNFMPKDLRHMMLPRTSGGPMRKYSEAIRRDFQEEVMNVYPRVASFDARDFLRHQINRVSEYGKLLCPWEERPFLWLLNWREAKAENNDFKSINERRISQLPAHVRKAITPED